MHEHEQGWQEEDDDEDEEGPAQTYNFTHAPLIFSQQPAHHTA